MHPAEQLFFWLIPICGGGALVGLGAGLWRGSRWAGLIAEIWGFVAFVLALTAWILRWFQAGHLPLFGTWESALSLTVAVLGAALLSRWLGTGASRQLWPIACAVAAVLLLHGRAYDPTPYALTISERSWVVDVHAVLAWSAFGCLAVNAGLALLVLRRNVPLGGMRGGTTVPSGGTTVPAPAADRLMARTLSLGFVLHSAMLASGSFYKFLLFGRAWSFDPIETLGFVAWVSYGALLHLHLLGRWQGRRLARWCLSLFVLLVISYRGIVYFPAWSTYHIFDMDLRLHVTGAE